MSEKVTNNNQEAVSQMIDEEVKHQLSSRQDIRSASDVQQTENDLTVEDFSYRDISDMSEVTEEALPDDMLKSGDLGDLNDYERLVQNTQKKLKLVQSEAEQQSMSESLEGKPEDSDEFLRNFFIKYGMTKTLNQFQQEWFELKAKGELDLSQRPAIPEIFLKNAMLSDELNSLQQQLDEANVTADKARSTYDKLRRQRDFQKINHRRVQQEKQKLNQDINKCKKTYVAFQDQFNELSAKYEAAVKEKMLIKLEKDRLMAKVENLETSLKQIEENEQNDMLEKDDISQRKTPAKKEPSKKEQQSKMVTNQPTAIPNRERFNPALNETFEAPSSHLNMIKTVKGHLMGVTSLSYNPKKDIVATGSDDTTWKLWSVPNGDLIMSGEGHQDWIGGICFHPKGNYLATASGDGSVKLWDFVNACCTMTYPEHGQPVWKVDFHDTGDFMISASMDHTVKLWDLAMKKSRFTFRGHVDSVNSVHFAPYSQMFASGSGDKTVSLWDIRTKTCTQTFYGHNNAVNCVNFNNRADKIVSADCDGISKVWDVRMVKEICQFDSGMTSTNVAVFDKSCTYILAGSEDSTIKFFNLQTLEKENELKGHEDAVLDLCFDNAKEGFLISASSDCSFKIWQ